jgi:hypothetical protein
LRLASVSTPNPGIGAEMKDIVEGGIVGYRGNSAGKGNRGNRIERGIIYGGRLSGAVECLPNAWGFGD